MMTLEGIGRIHALWDSTMITCPKCSHEQDMSDFDYAQYHITYWGDDGPKEYCCPNCDHSMMVQERVMRSFTIVEDDEE